MRPTRTHGFTLIEMLIAVVILVIIATGVARFSSSFSRSMSTSALRLVAAGVADDQLQTIRADPRYSTLVALYGTAASHDTTGFTDYPRMHRVTTIVRDQSGSPARDRTTVTVRVTDPAMKDTIAVTAIIASP
ncbi:MAG TPA: type II secretion system protein [Gemmatimonadales bacterium]|jgi:prepilin-type N-terminal cleavage/methylation domain-containing protein|nr:type II secretion system protein [Gemmatimonadales bacterium]